MDIGITTKLSKTLIKLSKKVKLIRMRSKKILLLHISDFIHSSGCKDFML